MTFPLDKVYHENLAELNKTVAEYQTLNQQITEAKVRLDALVIKAERHGAIVKELQPYIENTTVASSETVAPVEVAEATAEAAKNTEAKK